MNTQTLHITLADEPQTLALGSKLAQSLSAATVIFLHGSLGAGKTTLSRGIVQGLGHKGNVKSPTYTLVEPYQVAAWQVYHFDLYRLSDPEELEYMGIRDYFTPDSLCLVEWPERGLGMLPAPDMDIRLQYDGVQRMALIEASTPVGVALLEKLTT
ncbi:MAG: tRNA (adenosine(37)-N6)-threonylcarbamoyltransferase complex ATPase subunit type 1 TsaE [Oceanisphaera sp.]|uniref:tRNA (adenosine(37)-N6)-threonylcarbamoyltransferase complex ATPase subunit type 1 TsaE n=1 Tax=Oceanisphaera sp. TaxID=1929979 RepID=UPI003F9EAA2A